MSHARYYVNLLDSAQDVYLKGNQLEALALFDQERQQTDAVWQWLLGQNKQKQATDTAEYDLDQLILAMTNVTAYMGELRYSNAERIPQYEALLDAARRLGRTDAEVVAVSKLSPAYLRAGDADRALIYSEMYVLIAREIGDRRAEGNAMILLGAAYAASGSADIAIIYFESGLDGDIEVQTILLGLIWLGNAHYTEGDFVSAITSYEHAFDLAREIGDQRGEFHALGNLGTAHEKLGEIPMAIWYYQQALELARKSGDRQGEAIHRENLALCYKQVGIMIPRLLL